MTIGTPIRLSVPALLGVAAAVLVSCGGSGAGLIPAANAGPLQEDFEAVAKAAQEGNGSCTATEASLGKTEQDFLALPVSVDRALRARLEKGIANLRSRALAICAQSAPSSTATTGTQTTSTTQAPTETSTTSTETTTTTPTPGTPGTTPTSTATTPTTPTSPGPGGGTEAPGESSENGEGKGHGKDGEQAGESNNAESSSGGAGPGGGR